MKNIFLAAIALLLLFFAQAQQKQGKVVYERTAQMNIHLSDNNDEIAHMLPKSRTDKFELTFGNNQSLWVHADEEIENTEFGGNGMQINFVGPGQNDIVFHDF